MAVSGRFTQLLAEASRDAEAIHFDGAWTTWGSLSALSGRLAGALDDIDLATGGRVGVILENRPEHVGAVVSLLATERCIVSLSSLQPEERLIADIRRCQLPVVVASPTVLERPGIRAAIEESGVVIELTPELDARRAGGSISTDRVTSPGIVLEMLTSGTTGPPKRIGLGAQQLEKSLNAGGPAPTSAVLLRSGTSVVYTPLVHISGMWGSVAPLYAGRKLALLSRFSLEPWLAAIETHRPRSSSAVPAVLRAILEADVAPERLSSLKVVTSGTAPCPPELSDAMLEKYNIRVLSTYGATEFAGAVAAWTYDLHVQWWATKVGSTGRAMPGVELRVVDVEDGSVLGTNLPGILEVRAGQSLLGADHWVRTSDLARIDADGFLFIEGRTDDVIIRGGFKVHPQHVADVLLKHQSVRAAGVAPLPDLRLGAVPVAAVELVPGSVRPTGADLLAHCRAELLPYEVPVRILIVDAIPRTASLKVSQVELLDLVRAEMEAEDAESSAVK